MKIHIDNKSSLATTEWHIANGQGKRMMRVDENYKVTEVEQ